MPKRKAPFLLGCGVKRQSFKEPRQRTCEWLCLQTEKKKKGSAEAWEEEGLGAESIQYGE